MEQEFRNLTHLLGINEQIGLQRLLRAAGAEEACVTGDASDFDKFYALAKAMPLCHGNALAEELQRVLEEATGIRAPLCPHTAALHWRAFVKVTWPAGELEAIPQDLPTPCPLCAPSEPWRIPASAVTHLPNPREIPAPDPAAWTEAMEAVLAAAGPYPAVSLPAEYAFVRPNPYHATLALQKEGELSPRERDLLLTQALRVWGMAALRADTPLLLRGGRAEAVTALLTSLRGARALPSLVWIPNEPSMAEAVSGLYAAVRTGYVWDEREPSRAAAYARVAPAGRAVILT